MQVKINIVVFDRVPKIIILIGIVLNTFVILTRVILISVIHTTSEIVV